MKPTRNDLKNTIDECCCHLLNKRLNYTKEDAISEILKIHDQINKNNKKHMESINYEKTVKNIRAILEKYLVDNKLKSMVLGVSGGIDSALVCALAYPVAKKLGIELIGRSITIETNKQEEIDRAWNIGRNFCTNFKSINLTDEYLKLKESLSDEDVIISLKETDTERKIRFGNVKARIRMVHIYDLAQKNKGFVLSTDNFTELMVGFWTLHGDVGDYGMIQELWKTEVYSMTQWIAEHEDISQNAAYALESMLDAVATDGLGITSSDLDQLIPDWKERHTTTREGYEEVDLIMEDFLNGYSNGKENHPIILRHKRTEFKRSNPLNLKREDIVE